MQAQNICLPCWGQGGGGGVCQFTYGINIIYLG